MLSVKLLRKEIKQIFKDWWDKFIETYPKLNIRDVVFNNVERMLKCQTWDLGYAIFKCLTVVMKKSFLILVNLECVLLVKINIINNENLPFFLNYLNVNIDMLFLLFQMN